VCGGDLFELYSDFTSTYRGSIAADANPAVIASNRFQLCIASGGMGYIYDLSVTAAPVAVVAVSQVQFGDGYFIGLTPGSQMIRLSGQYDGKTWNPLDFTSAEGDPDNIVGLLADHREIWTLGAESGEVFWDSGNPDMPYQRIQGALIEQGCAAAYSPLKNDNAIFWLGQDSRGDRIFWRAQGYTPIRVSNHAIEYELSQMSRVDDCIGYAYQLKGHAFCVWHFPTGDRTFVYDCAIQDPKHAWHELASWDKVHSVWHRHKGQVHCFAFGRHLVGDYETGIVYEQSINIFNDNGSEKRWMRAFPLPTDDNKYVFAANLEVLMESGQGMDVALGGIDPGNPQVMMRYSKDGGYTFGNEKWCGSGKIGQYGYRCRWPGNLGQARKPYVELSGTDPVRMAMIEGYIDMESGNA
jgi:hypothetical protein